MIVEVGKMELEMLGCKENLLKCEQLLHNKRILNSNQTPPKAEEKSKESSELENL